MIYLGQNPIGLAYNTDIFDYEEGIYIPSQDITDPTINFTNIHNKRPFIVMLSDITTTSVPATNSTLYWNVIDYSQYVSIGEQFLIASQNTECIGVTNLLYKTASSVSLTMRFLSDSNASTSGDISSYVNTNHFVPKLSTSFSLRSGRSYKWIAIWKKDLEVISNA